MPDLEDAFVFFFGDDFYEPPATAWLRKVSEKYHTVLGIDGRLPVEIAFAEKGYVYKPAKPGEPRPMHTLKERQLTRAVYEELEKNTRNRLTKLGIHVTTQIRVHEVGDVICPISCRQLISEGFLAFSRLFVVAKDAYMLQRLQNAFSYDSSRVQVLLASELDAEDIR